MAAGVTTLPFDFDIFLRSGSTMKPLIPAFSHGMVSLSSCARSMVENSQVRMMSCPWERSEYGNTRSNSSGSRSQPPASCGVRRRGGPGVHDVDLADEAAGNAALALVVAGGGIRCRVDGQRVLGRHDDGAALLAVRVQLVPDRQRHAEEALAGDQPVAGEAVDPVLVAHPHEFGVKFTSRPRSSMAARSFSSRAPLLMYHWRVETISSGLSPFSKNLTGCVIGFGSPISSPLAVSSSTMARLAENTVLPASSA